MSRTNPTDIDELARDGVACEYCGAIRGIWCSTGSGRVGGVQVAAAVTELPGLGKKPVVVFHFARPDGTMHNPIALIADDAQMARLVPLITAAVNKARRTAGRP